jgi:hypothetical protein
VAVKDWACRVLATDTSVQKVMGFPLT